jgi:hypothetical protein
MLDARIHAADHAPEVGIAPAQCLHTALPACMHHGRARKQQHQACGTHLLCMYLSSWSEGNQLLSPGKGGTQPAGVPMLRQLPPLQPAVSSVCRRVRLLRVSRSVKARFILKVWCVLPAGRRSAVRVVRLPMACRTVGHQHKGLVIAL